ncbi:MAG: SAM-dependent methyltransferase [Alphaproteobacteria bacterium]|nr:SAM-dependent methyltransferase [Alphaproteobacteria bacterium]
MTSLRQIINDRIKADGFISLHDYMDLVLYHPRFGYYRKEAVIGEAGGFITAPEISQMFGELTGLWLAHQCQTQHLESKAALVELGPGRGTLMADLIRAWRQTALTLPPIHLVETSPSLQATQAKTISHITEAPTHWHQAVDQLPNQPLLIIANEFFDALPVRQFRYTDTEWQERGIMNGPSAWQMVWRPVTANDVPDSIFELATTRPAASTDADTSIIAYAPHLPAIMASLSARIKTHGGAMLVIDYGKADCYGDTVQAVHNHQPVDLLFEPGTADLTAWVDFSHLAKIARANGLAATPLQPQGQFLKSIGIKERTEQLSDGASPELKRRLLAELDRLVNPAQMGQAFKVMAILPSQTTNTDILDLSSLPGWTQLLSHD